MTYDVAVVGLGGIGAAIVSHCAARGATVIGFEQYSAAHELGSSSGRSRMIRQAYFENPAYVPLLLRAYELWRELEHESGEDLLTITGLLMVGRAESEVIAGARRAAQEHKLAIESLTVQEMRRRYPDLHLLEGETGVFEPEGGVLRPERAIRAHLHRAADAGAHLHFGKRIEQWKATRGEFELYLSDNSHITARTLILALGPWFKEILQGLGVPITVQRNVQAWFTPAKDTYNAPRFPAFLLDRQSLPAPLYGFPDFGDGVKAAFHGYGEVTHAQRMERELEIARDIQPIAQAMEEWMPGAAHTLRDGKPCLYTCTPDGHFVIDRHPEHDRLILCGGFSGHGFKFAPVIGEVVADLALDGKSRHDIEFLSLRRFAPG